MQAWQPGHGPVTPVWQRHTATHAFAGVETVGLLFGHALCRSGADQTRGADISPRPEDSRARLFHRGPCVHDSLDCSVLFSVQRKQGKGRSTAVISCLRRHASGLFSVESHFVCLSFSRCLFVLIITTTTRASLPPNTTYTGTHSHTHTHNTRRPLQPVASRPMFSGLPRLPN